MTKICEVCGFTTEDKNLEECPNCGNFNLKAIKKKDTSDRFQSVYSDRFRRF